MRSEQLRGHLEMLILGALACGPAHGYGVIAMLHSRSNGILDLNEGAVYPALHRLEDGGLVASTWQQVEGRRRRIYTLTAAGADALREQREGWHQLTQAVNAVMNGAASAGVRFA